MLKDLDDGSVPAEGEGEEDEDGPEGAGVLIAEQTLESQLLDTIIAAGVSSPDTSPICTLQLRIPASWNWVRFIR